jgi:hypothetical protein
LRKTTKTSAQMFSWWNSSPRTSCMRMRSINRFQRDIKHEAISMGGGDYHWHLNSRGVRVAVRIYMQCVWELGILSHYMSTLCPSHRFLSGVRAVISSTTAVCCLTPCGAERSLINIPV